MRIIQPKVSVIIPFYSRVNWLEEAVESVLSQTYTNYEIILVNDGSKEDLRDFLSRYRSKLTYIEQANQGPAAARNNGIRHASGEYIGFQDSDDHWLNYPILFKYLVGLNTQVIWTIPFGIERVYIRYLFNKVEKNQALIKRSRKSQNIIRLGGVISDFQFAERRAA